MNILLSAYSCEPNRGSEMEMGWKAVDEMAASNAQVTVVTKTTSKDAINRYLADHPSVADKFSNIQFIYYELPVWVQKFKRVLLGAQFHAYMWEIGLFFFLRTHYRKNEFDLAYKVTVGSYRFPSLIWYFARRFVWGPFCSGERFPLKFFSIYSWRGIAQESMRLLIRRLALIDPLVLLTLHQADCLIAITEDTKNILPTFARRKTTVTPKKTLLVDPSAFDPVDMQTLPERNVKNPLRLLYIGRMLEWKGVMLVLRALKELNGRLAYEFTLMGEGPAKSYYEAYVKKHKLNVVFVSPKGIPRRKLSAYYLSHDLFIFPGMHGGASYVMVEAQLHQLPVLMLDITAPPCFKQESRDIIIDTESKPVAQIITEIANAMLLLAGSGQVHATTSAHMHTQPVSTLGQNQKNFGTDLAVN